MNYTLRHLRYFVAAADAGSISEAARALNVAQPSVSTAISHLEGQFGVGLFLRKPSLGVKLTPAGAQLLKEARNLLNYAVDFEAMALDLSDSVTGEIHVASFVNIAPIYMAGIIRTFQERYPRVSVRMYVGNQQEILDGIQSGKFEMALTFDLGLTNEYSIDVISELPPQLVIPANHRLAGRKDVSLLDVASEPFIYLDLPHSRDYFFSLFRDSGLRPQQSVAVASFETIRTFVGNGLGFSLLNLVTKNVTNYDGTKVVYVPLTEPARSLQICCVRSKRGIYRRACLAFIDHVRDFFHNF